MALLEIKIGTATTMAPLDDFAASLGRSPENTIIVNDPDVSRRHCIIERYEKGYRVHDLGSRNGTKLNGTHVAREPLKNDDIIKIGGAEIRFVDVQPKRAPLRVRLRSRAALWCMGALAIGVCVFIVGWQAGWFGDSMSLASLQSRFIDSENEETLIDTAEGTGRDTAIAREEDDGGKAGGTSTAPTMPQVTISDLDFGNSTDEGWIERYELLTADTLNPRGRKDLMRPVRAIFLGKPLKGDDDRLFWDLPPSGELIALIDPGNPAYDALNAEPVMLEAECCGILQRRMGGSGLFLMVGEMRIVRAWVGDDTQLQPATRAILGKRIVVNSIFTAEKVQAAE